MSTKAEKAITMPSPASRLLGARSDDPATPPEKAEEFVRLILDARFEVLGAARMDAAGRQALKRRWRSFIDPFVL